MRVLVLHGPNLNLVGTREPERYGTEPLEEINRRLEAIAAEHESILRIVQSSFEGALIDEVHRAIGHADGVLVNAGGLTHTSVALRDAVAAGPPAVEVHITNIYAREPFRRRSLLAPVCVGGVYGFGADAYRLGLLALLGHLERARAQAPGPRRMEDE